MAICSFIGLGVMGYPMAGHLATHGYQTRVYNRTAARATQWQNAYAGSCHDTPQAAAAEADMVMVCVGNDDDVRSVVFGQHGALSGMQPGSILVDHTTTSAELAREIAAAAQDRGIGFLDAPVSGGEIGAVNGQLTIMVGGEEETFARARDVLEVYAKSVRLMGEAGAGQLTKMVNQICIAGLLQGLSEGLHFAECAGLDIEAVVEVISKGAAQSWQMENRFKTMKANEFDFGFAVDWMRKDLAICLAEAKRNNAPLPVTQIIDGFYADVQGLGGGRWDTSSLIARLRS
jgi:3-hydroxyisobutyrate dehydrogenase-like beta-hydroxyacid dehydrogenase